MGKEKAKSERKLKPYEIDENVIDLDAFVAFHTEPRGRPEEDLIIFEPSSDDLELLGDSEFLLLLDADWLWEEDDEDV
jgi:hypothetical protein